MNCPSCGHSIGFRSERAPYAVCPSCATMVVRKDIDVEALGKVAECQADGSPVQLGTRGRYNDRSFEVVGRMQLAYSKGYWNEWFLLLDNGEQAWLGEAMGQYFFSIQVEGPAEIRPVAVGSTFRLSDGTEFVGVDSKQVQVAGFEGELPFVVQSQAYYTCDLRNSDGEALTIDFADGHPSYYRGRMVFFPELHLTGLRESEDPSIAVPASQVKKVTCSSCGAPSELSTGPQSKLLVCEYCGSAMDSSNPELKVLESYADRAQELAKSATIPLGSQAKLQDGTYKVIGFVIQSTQVEGITYHWKEYLLYNHLNGYLWLSETNGHFTLFTPLEGVPHYQRGGLVARPEAQTIMWQGKKFKHFQTSRVRPAHVLGEFYWRLDVREESTAADYIAPPYLLSASVADSDVTWSLGRYLEREELAEIFPDLETFGNPTGIAPNQTNPHYAHRRWMVKPALATLLLAWLFVYSGLFLPGEKTVYKSEKIAVTSSSDKVILRDTFQLPGKSHRGLRIKLAADLDDRWVQLTPVVRTINPARAGLYRTPPAPTVILADAQGAKTSGDAYIASVGAGECSLEIQQLSGPPVDVPALVAGPEKPASTPLYSLSVEVQSLKNSPAKGVLFWVVMLLGYAFYSITSKASKFETARWYESDYG